MNREEILSLATGQPVGEYAEARQYRTVLALPDQQDHWAILGIDKRQVIVRDSQPVGPDIGTAATTVTVTALMHLYCVEEHRGEGHESDLILEALAEAATHRLVPYAAVFATEDNAEFWAKVGFWHPERSPEGFMVYELHEEPWPDGSVDTRGRW